MAENMQYTVNTPPNNRSLLYTASLTVLCFEGKQPKGHNMLSEAELRLSLAAGTAVVKLATGRGKESVVVDAKQQLCKVRAWLVTSYTWQHFKQQTWLTLKILYSNSN